ncbi:MAG: hypothetical protein WC375_00175 [Methanomassiliicoccales archaeon]|jgi:predicted lactoylglutathione lyase
MKKNSVKSESPDETHFKCPSCHFFVHKSKAVDFQKSKGVFIKICPNCYRQWTAPSAQDILRAVMFAQLMSKRRHEMLWGKQIKKSKRNTSAIGSLATESIKLVEKNLEATIDAILLHDGIVPCKKLK